MTTPEEQQSQLATAKVEARHRDLAEKLHAAEFWTREQAAQLIANSEAEAVKPLVDALENLADPGYRFSESSDQQELIGRAKLAASTLRQHALSAHPATQGKKATTPDSEFRSVEPSEGYSKCHKCGGPTEVANNQILRCANTETCGWFT